MEWNPEDYAKHSNPQLAWANELIAKLSLSRRETILDVGCGDGKITAKFATSVPNGFVLGVDSSAAFIDYARLHYPPSSYPNLQFKQMGARQLAYVHQFDIIFSNAALHWIEDQQEVVARCAHLLKSRGKLVISCGGSGNASDFIAIAEKQISQHPWKQYFVGFTFPYYFYSPTEYKLWLPSAGLDPARVELVEKDMTHQGRESLAAWVRTTWMPYTSRVPENMREPFILECVDAYLNKYPVDEQGRSHLKMVRLEVEAYKGSA
jgi:trans-aconitate 2-methyltransferase